MRTLRICVRKLVLLPNANLRMWTPNVLKQIRVEQRIPSPHPPTPLHPSPPHPSPPPQGSHWSPTVVSSISLWPTSSSPGSRSSWNSSCRRSTQTHPQSGNCTCTRETAFRHRARCVAVGMTWVWLGRGLGVDGVYVDASLWDVK